MADRVNGKGAQDQGPYEPPALKGYELQTADGSADQGGKGDVRKEGWRWVFERGPQRVELQEERLGDVEMMLWRLESKDEGKDAEKRDSETGGAGSAA